MYIEFIWCPSAKTMNEKNCLGVATIQWDTTIKHCYGNNNFEYQSDTTITFSTSKIRIFLQNFDKIQTGIENAKKNLQSARTNTEVPFWMQVLKTVNLIECCPPIGSTIASKQIQLWTISESLSHPTRQYNTRQVQWYNNRTRLLAVWWMMIWWGGEELL